MPTQRKTSASGAGNGAAAAANGGSTVSPGILGGFKHNVTSRVDEQKNRAADGLGGIADVIRSAGHELRSENEALAKYVDQAGDQLRRLADQIRHKGVADMLDDLDRFAHRRPALFIGGAFLAGLAVARFVKSSAARSRGDVEPTAFSDVDPMTTQTAPTFGNTSAY